jgi:hypothetical protein
MLKAASVSGKAFLSIFFLSLAVCSFGVYAQSSGEQPIKGNWLVSVHGEDATRTLSILGEVANAKGSLLVAKYGMTGKAQKVIEASVERVGNERKLNFVTQAATVVSATEQSNRTFYGTFALKSGSVKAVLITKLPDSDAVETVTKSP